MVIFVHEYVEKTLENQRRLRRRSRHPCPGRGDRAVRRTGALGGPALSGQPCRARRLSLHPDDPVSSQEESLPGRVDDARRRGRHCVYRLLRRPHFHHGAHRNRLAGILAVHPLLPVDDFDRRSRLHQPHLTFQEEGHPVHPQPSGTLHSPCCGHFGQP